MTTHSIPDVAESLGVSQRTVEAWIASGELVAVCVSRDRNSRKPRLRVRECDLQAFLVGREVGADAKPKRVRRRQQEIPRYV